MIGALAAFTLAAVLLFGAWEITKIRQHQRQKGEKPTGGLDTLTGNDKVNEDTLTGKGRVSQR